MVDVKPQHLRQQMIEPLPFDVRIRVRCPVPGRHVQHPVEAEHESVSVMPVRLPVDDPLFRFEIERLRYALTDFFRDSSLQRVPIDVASLRLLADLPVPADINEPVLLKVRMKAHTVIRVLRVEQNLKLARRTIIDGSAQPIRSGLTTIFVDEKQPLAARFPDHKNEPLRLQVRQHLLRSKRQRWIGRADDGRRRERDELVDPEIAWRILSTRGNSQPEQNANNGCSFHRKLPARMVGRQCEEPRARRPTCGEDPAGATVWR